MCTSTTVSLFGAREFGVLRCLFDRPIGAQYLSREEEASNVDVFQEAGDAVVIQECKAQFDSG
jgi:hypothetical protein